MAARKDELRATVDALRATIETLNATIHGLQATLARIEGEHREREAALQTKLDAALRQLYGKKSERRRTPRLVSPAQAIAHADGAKAHPQDVQTRREANRNALADAAMDEEKVVLDVPLAQRECPSCGGIQGFREVGAGRESVEFDYVPGYFRRRIFVQKSMACRCGQTIVTAPAPVRVFAKSKYGPGLVAHLIVSKCGDSIPVFRLTKQLRRHGVPVSNSTLNDLFLRAGEKLRPLYEALLADVVGAPLVLADETPIKLQSHDKRAYVWVFRSDAGIVFRFAKTRSGKTPVEVLGGTRGTLLVDAYTGYNAVTAPEGRQRAGCLAHARRKFHEALPTAPEAQNALDLILDVYRVEHDAKAAGIVRTAQHLALRQTRSRDAMEKLRRWLAAHKDQHPPKSPLGHAIRYASGQWKALTRFLDDADVPVDNNASERALRAVATMGSLCVTPSSARKSKRPLGGGISTRARAAMGAGV